jgi:hypothetical protein
MEKELNKKETSEKETNENELAVLKAIVRSYFERSKLLVETNDRATKIFYRMVFVFIYILSILLVNFYHSENITGYEKNKIKSGLVKLISSGAGFNEIKHYHEQFDKRSREIAKKYDPLKDYRVSTSVLLILKDLEVDNYLDSEMTDGYMQSLKSVISEFENKDPFSMLEDSQKQNFETVRALLGDKYPIIEKDFKKISNNLIDKNKIEKELLGKSELSFYISIASFIFAIVMAFIGFRNPKSKSNNIDEVKL